MRSLIILLWGFALTSVIWSNAYDPAILQLPPLVVVVYTTKLLLRLRQESEGLKGSYNTGHDQSDSR
jgi:hypothetical protein